MKTTQFVIYKLFEIFKISPSIFSTTLNLIINTSTNVFTHFYINFRNISGINCFHLRSSFSIPNKKKILLE